MAARFHAAIIERIRQAANDSIAEIAEQYAQLRKCGPRYVSRCIFHSERTPSLSLTPGRGFHCFGCGASGDAIRFLMLAEKIDFPSAVRKLAQRFGIPLEDEIPTQDDRKRRERADAAAWHAYDEIARLRCYYTDALHRADRLCAFIGKRLRAERNPHLWDSLARLAPAQTFFLAAFQFLSSSTPANLARFAFASAVERRAKILEGAHDELATAA